MMETSRLSDSPIYNSRILDSYLKIVRLRYSYVNVAELLEYAGMKSYEIADQAHWFTQEQVDRFYEKLVQMTGNSNIAREAGRFAASPDALGVMRQYVLSLMGASNTFQRISRITKNFTRSSSYQSRTLGPRRIEISVIPNQPGLEKKFQCDNRIGFFEAVVLMFSSTPPRIEHPECMFAGGEVCRYLIQWEKSLAETVRKIRNGVLLVVAAANLILLVTEAWRVLQFFFPASLIIAVVAALIAERSEKNEFLRSLIDTRESNENLVEQINLNYNNARMANEIGRALGSYTSLDQMLTDVAQVMEKRLDYDRGLILLADGDGTMLELRASYGYSTEELNCLRNFPFLISDPHLRDIYVSSFREQRPFVINDLQDIEQSLEPHHLACAKTTGTRSFICCPIVFEGTSLGVLAVENVKAKKPLVERDISLIMGTASVIGISIRNYDLIEALTRAKEELELRVAARTADLERSRASLESKNRELEETYHDLEEETAQRLAALERLRENERMLIQQSRLAALGEMISNIAHQWRQPLNELGLIVQELPMMYDRGNFSREYLKASVAKFMKVVSHLSKTIDDFRNFFKPEKEKVDFQVREAIETTLSLIAESFKHLQIDIRVKVTGDPIMRGYPNEFSQVILNILFNARDAFLERQVEKPWTVEVELFWEEEHTVVLITDNAGGIPTAIMDKIFDPYFTTRGPDKGTGIGLYMSKTIIEKNLEGRLSARNTERGAQFRIEV